MSGFEELHLEYSYLLKFQLFRNIKSGIRLVSYPNWGSSYDKKLLKNQSSGSCDGMDEYAWILELFFASFKFVQTLEISAHINICQNHETIKALFAV